MTAHDHSTVVPGCFRCELGRDELTAQAPTRLLLCLGPCHGEFYLPLAEGERVTCPVDGTHPVALYGLVYTNEHPEDPA